MKNNQKLARTLRLIASHALVAAIVSQPYFVSLFSDLLYIATSDVAPNAAVADNLLSGLSVISGTAFVVAIVAFAGYLLVKQK